MIIWSNVIFTLISAAVLFLIFEMLAEKYRKQPEQSTACYCPECDNELISSGSFVSYEDYVVYQCSKCGDVSKWYFDAPVPILIEGDGKL